MIMLLFKIAQSGFTNFQEFIYTRTFQLLSSVFLHMTRHEAVMPFDNHHSLALQLFAAIAQRPQTLFRISRRGIQLCE